MPDFQKFITTCMSSVTVFITLQEKTSLSTEHCVCTDKPSISTNRKGSFMLC